MREFTTYLMFDGNARDAMKFYAECMGADLQMMPYSESPAPCAPADKDKLMHARLTKGKAVLMASDWNSGVPVKFNQGNNFNISLNCESADEAKKYFNSLSQGGHVTMPLGETFWAKAFGMFTDKFGINWMINFEKPH